MLNCRSRCLAFLLQIRCLLRLLLLARLFLLLMVSLLRCRRDSSSVACNQSAMVSMVIARRSGLVLVLR